MTPASEFFRALGDEERLRILRLLLSRREGACVCELVDALRMPQYQVSRQLAVLREAGVVMGAKRGTWVYYEISWNLGPLARAALETLREHPQSDEDTEDQRRFDARFNLRADGVCVIGYEPNRPFRDTIPNAPVGGKRRRQ